MSITIPMWLLYIIEGIAAIVAFFIFIIGLCFIIAIARRYKS